MSEQKIEAFWRDATAEDVAKVMRGEQLQARFRDKCFPYWTEHYLCGVNGRHWIAGNFRWDLCQVYDPPQWYIDKPDPGEGYRLLEKFPNEPKLGTDEAWQSIAQYWRIVRNDNGVQQAGTWYRRRIEPIPQEVGSRSKDNIPSGWQKIPDDEPRLACDAYWSQGAKDWVLIGDSRVEYANSEKWPAIRQVNSYVSLMSSSSAFEYRTKIDDTVRLPNGKRFKITQEGFEVL